jgi:hypothetical protein
MVHAHPPMALAFGSRGKGMLHTCLLPGRPHRVQGWDVGTLNPGFLGGNNMHLTHLSDYDLDYFLMFTALPHFLFFIRATVLETIILRSLKWGSFMRSLLMASFVNLATTMLSLAISIFTHPQVQLVVRVFALKNILYWGITVALEGGLLALMDKKPLGKGLVASCAMNAGSYVLLHLLPLLLSILEH